MKIQNAKLYWLAWLSALLAFLLELVPLPYFFAIGRPVWILLIIVYWVLNFPKIFNIGFAFSLGIISDVLTESHFGIHSIVFVTISCFIAGKKHQIRAFTWIQQIFILILIVTFYQLAITRYQTYFFQRDIPILFTLLPSITTAIIWPYTVKIFQNINKNLQTQSQSIL